MVRSEQLAGGDQSKSSGEMSRLDTYRTRLGKSKIGFLVRRQILRVSSRPIDPLELPCFMIPILGGSLSGA